jgi:hypothetical protein
MGGKDSGRAGRVRARPVLVTVVGLAGLVLGGCTSGGPPPASRPPDFTLAVTVFEVPTPFETSTGEGESGPEIDGESAPDPALEPDAFAADVRRPAWDLDSRYVLEPDGLLRAEFGPAARQMGFPPIARRLRPEEFDDLYTFARSRGLLEADPRGRIPGPETFVPDGDQPQAVVETVLEGRRRSLAREVGDGGDGAARALVERLAELVWVRVPSG